MFALTGIRKAFGEAVVLDGIDLTIEPRTTVALIGPSGCGKSTLLRLMNGLLAPDAGVVRFDGAEMVGAALTPARRRIGYVVQEGGLFAHLTARQNVTLLGRRLGWSKPQARDRAAELAEMARLDLSLLDRYPHELSGGQRQRVALMRALANEPEALLLDEPLGALDPMVRADLQDELKALFERLDKTVVLVTHDLAEAQHLAGRVVLLHDGSIAQDGPHEAMLREPASDFVRRFVNAQRRLHGMEGAAS
ncbi:MAG: ATP-binding cassette domain-containing protein [Phycisphaera sp.]|nr:MAG: ATP-binding cassette domain-containing protein [Phycisphaera sp.]